MIDAESNTNKSSLRLYPALAYMERVSTTSDIIPLRDPVKLSSGNTTSEIFIQPGQVCGIRGDMVTHESDEKRLYLQTVIIPIIAIHRQDDVWKDPDTFRPERWLEEMPPSDRLNTGWENILAFSDGPRNCIGTHLGMSEYSELKSHLMNIYFQPCSISR